MTFTLSHIDRQRLSQMQDALNRSAGYQISMEDELRYFDPQGSFGWLVATNHQEQIVGFIRQLKQDENWSLGELYVDDAIANRHSVASQLLREFGSIFRVIREPTSLPARHRLRFDVLESDFELNSALHALGFSERRQVFRYFEKSMMRTKTDKAISTQIMPLPSDASEIANVLTNLSPVSETDVRTWINDGVIRVVSNDSRIVAAAQIYIHGDSAEINRIATDPSYLRQGYAARLLSEICAELSILGVPRLFLKVEDIRTPAISLYQKAGFMKDKMKTQIWHSSWSNRF